MAIRLLDNLIQAWEAKKHGVVNQVIALLRDLAFIPSFRDKGWVRSRWTIFLLIFVAEYHAHRLWSCSRYLMHRSLRAACKIMCCPFFNLR